MKKKIINILQAIFGLVIIGVCGLILIVFIKTLIFAFSQLQKEVAAGIIAALSAVIISILSIILTKYFERKAEVRKEHRAKKVPIYEELISFLFKILFSEKAGEKPPIEKDIIKFLTDFTQKLIIWGSDNVLKSFYVFREKLINADRSKPLIEGMFLFEKLLLEIRKDLGHKNKNIKKGDILGLFVNDIEKYL